MGLFVAARGWGQQLGACCLPDGSCVETTGEKCKDAGGEFHPGRRCEDVQCNQPIVGACCFEDQGAIRCKDGVTREDCDGVHGKFFPGVKCSAVLCDQPVKGACCLPDGSCKETEAQECKDAGGRFFPGESCNTPVCQVAPDRCIYIVNKVKAKQPCTVCPVKVGDKICGEECRGPQDCRKKIKIKRPCSSGGGGFCKIAAKLVGCGPCPD